MSEEMMTRHGNFIIYIRIDDNGALCIRAHNTVLEDGKRYEVKPLAYIQGFNSLELSEMPVTHSVTNHR